MKAFFLSDAHLKNFSDPGYKKCVQFFSGLTGGGANGDPDLVEIDLLVIAGDFFDFWFEKNGRIYPEFKDIVERIRKLKEKGVRVCVCEGNHDFFLADFFEKRVGIEVYPDDLELALDDLKVFVSHGDTVDEVKKDYLALRRFLRSSFTYRLQRMLPLRLLWSMAKLSSGMSREMTPNVQKRLIEAMHAFAQKKFEKGFDAVILGHSHVSELTETKYQQKPRTFVTLGDWVTQYVYLIYENGRFSLCRF
jgi:UDP-2,3-diacylglucosamine hydrolase